MYDRVDCDREKLICVILKSIAQYETYVFCRLRKYPYGVSVRSNIVCFSLYQTMMVLFPLGHYEYYLQYLKKKLTKQVQFVDSLRCRYLILCALYEK